MSEPAAQTIRSLLHDLEEQWQIKILFAVESGRPRLADRKCRQ